MNLFQVCVITPVYNAANSLTRTVESALAQSETGEVILIEDGSPDDSLAVCRSLAEKYDKVRLLSHPGGKNRGAGASRNLGMKHAQYDYIAFLDADDYYLPRRFEVAKEIFISDPECDGVYEAMGIHFESKQVEKRWRESHMASISFTTITKIIPPENLFKTLVLGGAGYFSICALTIKKSILDKIGYMNEDLRLHQDTDFILRLSAVTKLKSGRLNEPVVIRGVHEDNRISKPRSKSKIYQNRMKMWKATHQWLIHQELKDEEEIVFNQMLHYCEKSKPLPFNLMNKYPREFKQLSRLSLFPFDYPTVILKRYYWKKLFNIPLWSLFRRHFS